MTGQTEALLVGGRAGVGKSSVGYEIHEQLSAAGLRHCLIEGDNLDMAYPAPWEHHLAHAPAARARMNVPKGGPEAVERYIHGRIFIAGRPSSAHARLSGRER